LTVKIWQLNTRWAHDNYDSFPALTADLVKRQVSGIVTIGGEQSALAAKAATNKIPSVIGLESPLLAVLACLGFSRENQHPAFSDFCNTIDPERTPRRFGLGQKSRHINATPRWPSNTASYSFRDKMIGYPRARSSSCPS
jgi:hypothetical protein